MTPFSGHDIIHAIPGGIVATDADGCIVEINRQALEILELQPDEAMGAEVQTMSPLLGRHVKQCLKLGNCQYGAPIQGPKGKLVLDVAPIRKNGRVVGAVGRLHLRSSNEQFALQPEAYQQLNEQMEMVFNASSDGLVILDGVGTLLRMNRAAQKLNGWKEADIIGKNAAEMVAKGLVDRSVALEVLATRRRVSRIQHIRTTGKQLLVTGTPMLDDDGNATLVVLNERDLTQLNTLKAELEETRLIAEKFKDEVAELSLLELKQQEIVAKSEAMRHVLRVALKLAKLEATNVLITGESGTGKGLLAKFIHHNRKHKNKPLVQINCAALPENLLEAELFGYEKGAFTGAREEGKAGLFELARGGTLFLDEIGDMPLNMQAKLLKYLDDHTITHLGGTKPIEVACSVIAATNRDLESLVNKEAFRSDLYYRLNVFSVKIPPLRERPDDIFDLARHFVTKYSQEYHLKRRISVSSLRALQRYPFPGNVRELMNVINKAVVISEQEVLDDSIAHFLNESLPPSSGNTPAILLNQSSLSGTLLAVEKEMLERALKRCTTTYELAQALGISQSTAFRKLKRHKLATKIHK